MDRRQFLGAAAAVAFGGCLGVDQRTTTTEPLTAVPADGITIEDPAVRDGVTYTHVLGSGGVLASGDRQYLLASVRTEAGVSGPSFSFHAGGQTWEPGLPDHIRNSPAAVGGYSRGPAWESQGESSSYLVFSLPSPLLAARPRIRYGDEGVLPLPDALSQRLAEPSPAFERRSLSVPETVSQGESLPVSLTVENTSDVDGRFLAAVYWPTELIADDDESHVLETQVPAGERASVSRDLRTEYTCSDPGPVTLRVEGAVRAARTVQVTDTERR